MSVRRALAVTSLAILLGACAPGLTEIVVVVDSDLAVPVGMDGVRISVANETATTVVATRSLSSATPTTLVPATVGVRPQQDQSAPVTITAEATLGGTAVVTAEVRTHFVPGRRIVLQIFLSSSCRMVVCPHGMTCRTGLCVDSTVDPGTLPPFTGSLDGGVHDAARDASDASPPDAHDAGDGGPLDANVDADIDAGCPSSAACDDGMFCNGSERCLSGMCVAGTAPSCDDLVDCTTDSCSGTACTHAPDDSLCTAAAGGHCDAATGCQYPTCTAATCHDDATTCTHAACAGSTCMRSSMCTAGQSCCAGACVVSGCDDANLCTDDRCDPTMGCLHSANSGVCDDGNTCTVGDVCSGGGCAGGPARFCDDFNVCTTESCDAVAGCLHTANAATCDDGNACTTGDHCAASACTSGPATCDDGVACTVDVCGGSGCTHAPSDALCTAMASGHCDAVMGCQYPTCTTASCPPDPSTCTLGVCMGATCTHPTSCSGAQMCCAGGCVPTGCDDGNACTTDACGGGGCTHSPLTGTSCPSGICNAGACCTGCLSGGTCQSGTVGGTCGFGGNACSSCAPCSGGVCTGGTSCASYFDVSATGMTTQILAIDTCGRASNFDFGTCFEGPVGTGIPDAVLSATQGGAYMISAGPGWTVGSLADSGTCAPGFDSCSTGGSWATSGSSGAARWYWGIERNSGCGRVTVTVTHN